MAKMTAFDAAVEINNINTVLPFLVSTLNNENKESNAMIQETINMLKRYEIILKCILSGITVCDIPEYTHEDTEKEKL